MSYRWFGAALVIAGCGGFGFSIASGYKREEGILRQLLRVLNYMEWELQYRLTPLPELCRQAGKETRGTLREVFFNLARELEWQTSPDAASCMTAALKRSHELPRRVRAIMKQLGHTLGRFFPKASSSMRHASFTSSRPCFCPGRSNRPRVCPSCFMIPRTRRGSS